MALLAKFSDAMSSMDVNCVVCGHGVAARVSIRRARPTAARRRRGGAWMRRRERVSIRKAPLSLAQRFFRTRIACLAPLLLGDELRHLAVDLLEGLKPRMGFNHSSHPVVAASVKQEGVGAQREHYDECRTNG